MSDQTDPIAEAWRCLKELSADPSVRKIAEARDQARRELNAEINATREEARQKERREIARRALRQKLPIKTIKILTGLPLKEIKQLATSLTD
ncbi:MAG: hypothetical protein LBU79_09225 [Planctomycetota bacterium]|jgi:ribosomal protein L7/L12|nr:hypothetical protein [Planctomycetota bacterium]